VYRIAMNCSLNLVERRGREASWNAAPLVSEQGAEMFASTSGRGPEQALLDSEATRLREQAMQQLTPMERAAFVLRHMEDQPIDVIAKALGVPANSAKQAVFRAVAKLRTALRPATREIL
jgi:RNA polymerase sigma-70 factor, ECF subfamily